MHSSSVIPNFAVLGSDMNPLNALPFFLFSLTITASVIAIESPLRLTTCHPGQRDALSRFNRSFSISGPLPIFRNDFCMGTSYPKTASWRENEDCCSWEGVTCDNSTGDVVGLDLSCARLVGTIDSSSSMFSLPHLRSLSLAGNNLIGVIPTEISHLSKLVSLNLSGNVLEMQNPTMKMLVRNLTQLEELDLSYNDMSTVIPTSLMNFSSSLISLHLSFCWLGGKFPENIFQLPNLQQLDLSRNFYLHGTLPESNWSSSLASLNLSHCSFTGEVLHSIGNFPRLTYLDLSVCFLLGGRFPEYIFQLPNLQMLDLSFNFDLHGTLPESNWSSSLTFLSLRHCSFAGEVPHSIGNLPRLTYLDISGNNFTGDVELRTFSTLKNLLFLGLSGRIVLGKDATEANPKFLKLEGLDIFGGNLKNFPCFLLGMPELSALYISWSFVSEFPGQCANNGLLFPQLQTLDMESCNLTKFPFFLSHSKKLRFLNLKGNKIEKIPSWFWGIGIETLEELDLENNLLKGGLRLPWKRLSILNLQNNSFEGPLPIPLTPSIREFDVMQNRFNGSISPSICQLTSLEYLGLGQNNLTGVIPPCFGNLTDLVILDLSNNALMGPLPLPSDATRQYSVSNNHFSGEISSLICNATNLWFLDLSSNGITGTLPQCLKNITMQLLYLNLRMNKFRGLIPEMFPKGCVLTSIDFSRNQLDGSLPRSLSNCQRLEALDVGSNKMVDSFPDWLGDLPLKVLSLRSNQFQGHLSVFGGTHLFSELRVLDLSNNGFEGNLSDNLINEMFGMVRGDDGNSLRYMTPNGSSKYFSVMINLKGVETEMVKIYIDFATLDMSSNHFGGEIPRNIGLLKSLKGLNFSHNSFTGTIPPSVGNLTNLESLDLSSNHLVGGIPKELVKLTSLGALDLSWNNLAGPIPSGGHFNTFSDSFEGNPGLCGIPLTRSCSQGRAEAQPRQEQRDYREDEAGGWLEWEFVAMGFGSGVVIGISLGYMAMETGRPLWLARMVIRLEANCRKRSKRKATKRNGQR